MTTQQSRDPLSHRTSGVQSRDPLSHRMSGVQSRDPLSHRVSGFQSRRISRAHSRDPPSQRVSGVRPSRTASTRMSSMQSYMSTVSNMGNVAILYGTSLHKTRTSGMSTVQYLKVTLKDVLPRALREVCQARPSDPIEFLAKCLYKSVDCELYFHEKAIFSREMQLMALQLKQENENRQSAIVKMRKQIQELKLVILKHKEIEALLWLRAAKKGDASFIPSPSESEESVGIAPKEAPTKRKAIPPVKHKSDIRKKAARHQPVRRELTSVSPRSRSPVTTRGDIETVIQGPEPETLSRRSSGTISVRSSVFHLSIARSSDVVTPVGGGKALEHDDDDGKEVEIKEKKAATRREAEKEKKPQKAVADQRALEKMRQAGKRLMAKKREVQELLLETRPHHSLARPARRPTKAEEKVKPTKQIVSTASEAEVSVDTAAVRVETGVPPEEVQAGAARQLKTKYPPTDTDFDDTGQDLGEPSEDLSEVKKQMSGKDPRRRRDIDEEAEEEETQVAKVKQQEVSEETTRGVSEEEMNKLKKKKAKKDLQKKREVREEGREVLEEDVTRDVLEISTPETLEDDVYLKKAKKKKRKKDLEKKRGDEEMAEEVLEEKVPGEVLEEKVPGEVLEEIIPAALEEEEEVQQEKKKKKRKKEKKREDEEEAEEVLGEEVPGEVLEEEEILEEEMELKRVQKKKRSLYKSLEDEYFGDADEEESEEEPEVSSEDSRWSLVGREMMKRFHSMKLSQEDFEESAGEGTAESVITKGGGATEGAEASSEAAAAEARVEETRKQKKKKTFPKKREDEASVYKQPQPQLDAERPGEDLHTEPQRQLDAERPGEDLHTDYDADEDTFQRTEEDISVETSEYVLAKTKKRRSKKRFSEDWSKIDVQQSEDEQEAPSKVKRKKHARRSTSVLKSASYEEADMEEYDQDRDLEPRRRMRKRSKKSEDEEERSAESSSSLEIYEDGTAKFLRKPKPRKKKGPRKKTGAFEEVPDSMAELEPEVVVKAPSVESVGVSESLHVSASSLRHEETEIQFTPVECQWSLVGPRVLVCRHPVLGEIRSQPPNVPAAQDFRFWPEKIGYEWHSFYDPEVYTVEQPYADDGRYKRVSRVTKRSIR